MRPRPVQRLYSFSQKAVFRQRESYQLQRPYVQRICLTCRKTFNICASCYRGQRYCGSKCRRSGSRIKERARGYRYRNNPAAREKARLRQQRFRKSMKKKPNKKNHRLRNARYFHTTRKKLKAKNRLTEPPQLQVLWQKGRFFVPRKHQASN